MQFPDWLQALIVFPTFWQSMTLLWVWSMAASGWHLNRTEQWFEEPMTSRLHLWEYAIMAGFLVFINTDLQLDGVLIVMKIQFIKEWWKHEKKAVATIALGLSTLLLILILSPIIGDWVG